MSNGELIGSSDGNLDRAYAVCSRCQGRKMKKSMHAVMSLDGERIIAWLCERCAPRGASV